MKTDIATIIMLQALVLGHLTTGFTQGCFVALALLSMLRAMFYLYKDIQYDN